VADANGDPVWLLSQDGPEAQFEMPVGGAVVSARFAACVPASYVDENGEERTVQAILLEDWMTRLTEGFYVVTGEVACASRVMARGDVTLILADGCALRFGTPEAPLAGCAIDADLYDLAIYGQAGGTGRLEIYNANGYGIYVVGGYAQHGGCVLVRTSGWHDCIYTDGSVVLDGGSLDVESESGRDIYAAGDIRIRGGRLSASGGGLYADSITLGHRSPTDSIYAADYSYRASSDGLKVAQALTDGTNVYTRRVEPVEIAGKTLTPVYRVIVGTTFIGEGRGRATAGKDYFAAGETVTLALAADAGYAPVALTARDFDENPVAVTNNAFTMPAGNVTVTATFGPVAFPAYLAGADDVVTNNYLAWAGKYGSDTDSSYASCFLLDLPPWTVVPEGAALLKIVEMGTTNIPTAQCDYGLIAMAMGYTGEELPCRRLVLASDVAQLKRREGFDTPFEACNGYLVLRIGGDLAAPLDEWLAMSWLVEFEDGRGEIVFPELFMEGIRGNLERAAGRPLGGLFLRPCISPVASLEWLSNIGILIEDP
jgi:hypothetical protein